MDLLDWHRGRLTSRRLAVLVRHLPRDSVTLRALHGEAADWSVAEYLLAAAVDQLAEANWMFATVNRDEDAEPLEYPEPVPRPGTAAGASGAADAADAARHDARTEPESGAAAAQTRNPSPAELVRFFS
ncbi:hypothetical protein [Streptomyces sp. SID10815]|uniref:hypothetical protein n=1 Tax=Streptomyces sp. SID10815 TaxID=2706027 RepID=UPI0013C63E18|nr:hypothetical protein [Streptomyces sp. SID10815]